jgi:Lrp/AsnC family leucine-responsive transcriptional regulator
VLDNYGTRKTPGVKVRLATHPRFHLHFTPTSASRLNLVERFFAEITMKCIRRGTFASVAELEQAIRDYLDQHNADPRLSNADLAERIGLSASPCWQRVKRLEDAGYIESYVAVLDQKRLGLPDTVIIEVTLEKHDDEDLLHRLALTGLPEVLEAYLTTGEHDYFVKVAVDGTEGYERFLREHLYRIPGIRHTRSCFALRCLKRRLSVSP